ncbi:hypothetical protein B0H14DRAFT_2581769 [Mycena olivaceomarginata]|nr:hypothetical protein B0H14DRAFT_2581769 [Mycena olivaceomarginata]
MTELQQRKRISQTGRLSIDELLDPADEREIGQALYELPAEVSDIIAQVVHEEAVARGDVMDVDEDDDETDAEDGPELSSTAIIDICRTLEKVCLAKGDPTASMVLANNLRQFRGQIQKEAATNARQITLGEAWGVVSTT